MKFLLTLILFVFIACPALASSSLSVPDSIKDTVVCAPAAFEQIEKNGESSVWIMYDAPKRMNDSLQANTDDKTETKDKLKRRKKIFAALLAFPVPFGIIGLHRIYLGTKPYVPLVYIATFGGAVGIIPFIDFIVLLLEKDITKYENNPSIVMWAK